MSHTTTHVGHAGSQQYLRSGAKFDHLRKLSRIDLSSDGSAPRFHPINHDDIVALKTELMPEGKTGRLPIKQAIDRFDHSCKYFQQMPGVTAAAQDDKKAAPGKHSPASYATISCYRVTLSVARKDHRRASWFHLIKAFKSAV
jgi:hypothetical protein